jgi:hypothetical protein
MHYFFEAILVGLYSCIIYLFVPTCTLPLTLLIVGFLKHMFGYFLGIHSYYCNQGDACLKYNHQSAIIVPLDILIGESILEGAFYICIGLLLSMFIQNKYLIVFLIGIIAHIGSEFIKLHDTFCKNRCE